MKRKEEQRLQDTHKKWSENDDTDNDSGNGEDNSEYEQNSNNRTKRNVATTMMMTINEYAHTYSMSYFRINDA